MKALDKFNLKMKISGGSQKNENINNSKMLLNETFCDDASFNDNICFWKLGIKDYSNEKRIGIRLYKRTYSAANGVTVKFQTLIDNPIVVGDIIYDTKEEEYLICTEAFKIDEIHYQGKFTLCNWILKWQNKNGDILEYPCYDINSTQYNSGEQSNRQFTVGSSQHTVLLPCDENTVVLSSPQRFFLDRNTIKPTSFIVTQNDTTSYNIGKKGIVRVTLYECERNSDTDRIDLGICDYIDKSETANNNSEDAHIEKSVIYYDTTTIKSGGDYQTFTAKFYDNEGNEIDNVIPKWNIICDFIDQLNVKQSGNRIRIGIDNDDYIDEEFKLVLSDSEDKFISTLIIKIESLL